MDGKRTWVQFFWGGGVDGTQVEVEVFVILWMANTGSAIIIGALFNLGFWVYASLTKGKVYGQLSVKRERE